MQHIVFSINALPSAPIATDEVNEILVNTNPKYMALRRYYEDVDADIRLNVSDAVVQSKAMGSRAKYSAENIPPIQSPAQTIISPDPAKIPSALDSGIDSESVISTGLMQSKRSGKDAKSKSNGH
jgi:hypothetical protein